MFPMTQALLNARASARPIADLGPFDPADLDAALAIQAEAFKARGEDVAGWKVAVRPDLGPVAAPIARSRVIRSGDQLAAPQTGLLGIEIELAVRLRAPIRRPIDRAGLMAAADAILVGVEICATRFTDVRSTPFLALLADDMSNYGYVMGEASPLEAFAEFGLPGCQVTANGGEIFSGPLLHPDGDPLAPAIAWLGASDGRAAWLDAGQFITTGALCGLLPIVWPCQIEVLAESFGPIRFCLT
jgi:2-keto-4-pentenoate hydratase